MYVSIIRLELMLAHACLQCGNITYYCPFEHCILNVLCSVLCIRDITLCNINTQNKIHNTHCSNGHKIPVVATWALMICLICACSPQALGRQIPCAQTIMCSTYICMYACMYVCVRMCTYVLYACMYVCM